MKKITFLLLFIQCGFIIAQTKMVVTPSGEKVTIHPNANNGLSAANGFIQLGGTLTQPSILTTTSSFTLAIKGLTSGGNTDNVLVTDADGVLKTVARNSFGGNDNLGNHIATMDLNMSNKSILNIQNAYIKNDLQIFDQSTSNTNYFSIYKNNGNFNILNNSKATNALTIDENTNKTTLQSTQITKGTDGITPQPGDLATAADPAGNIIWVAAAAVPGAIAGVYEFLGTNNITITEGTTKAVPMNGSSFTLKKSGKALITYSILPVPTAAGQPTQGSIDLMIDNNKTISSYYAAWDAPSGLVRLGNYSTAQKMISLPAGNHTVGLNIKSWKNTTATNVNPYADPIGSGYVGAISSDNQAMVARITVILFND